MISTLWLLTKRLPIKLVTCSVLILTLGTTPVVLAEKGAPDNDAPRGNTTSTGTRGGCENSTQGELTVLAPTKEGKTASVRPTFAWFVPDTKPLAMKFLLYELNRNNDFRLVAQIDLTSSSGIRKVTLTEDIPALIVGKRYHWKVVLLCDRNHPSKDLIAEADFEVVEMPSTLRNALSTTKEPAQIVQLYAQYNLWYDAFGEALRYEQDTRLKQVTVTLLNELAKIEEAQQGQKLRRIASSQQ
ncbi:hypothetical protein NIES2119_30575 [[Phormidium ambiguum] IAM M-71]|uniref:DUF928 domain-containing protein n=1 Tax=[Phormidium ambiguum] IAM M-71 TaxID=454136 RepID=A0A1U7I3G3_9CYAN|nr:DUF928 domain-containing protein [Phormidium ambiguum]OKH30670.1 hypothetical protein NIES2119_30575 [Phormidium ambiguum IAM M-71]